MAEKEKEVMVRTELFGYAYFGNEKKNWRRLSIGYFNDMIYVEISRPDPDSDKNSFSKKSAIYLKKNNIEMSIYRAAETIARRIKRMDKGENLKSDGMVIFTGKDFREALVKLSFNAYNKDDRQIIAIGIIKVDKDDKEKKLVDDIFYFSENASLYYRNKENKEVTDKEALNIFEQLAFIFKACSEGTSLSRDAHFRKYLSLKNGENKDNKGSSNSSSKSSKSNDDEEDNDDFPF